MIYGHVVLTSKWNNLNRILLLCSVELESAKKMWEDGSSMTDLVAHVIHFIMRALEHQEVFASSVTMAWLDKTKDG